MVEPPTLNHMHCWRTLQSEKPPPPKKKTYELRIKAVNTFDKNVNKLCKDKL